MELIADILLIGGALAAALYCVVLSRRLRRFTDLEKGVGGAIAVLSAQVDDMTKTLSAAQVSSIESARSLDRLATRAESVARRLELLVASMHDLPGQSDTAAVPQTHNGATPAAPAAPKIHNPTPEPAARDPEMPTPESPASESHEGPLFLSTRNRVEVAAE